jgi:hypothetical protein
MKKQLELDFFEINLLSLEYDYDVWVKKLHQKSSKQNGFNNLFEVLMEYKEEYVEWCRMV